MAPVAAALPGAVATMAVGVLVGRRLFFAAARHIVTFCYAKAAV